jgi:hypothetical protein
VIWILLIGMAFRIIPWVLVAIVVAGWALAAWTKRARAQAWADMGRVFDEL